MGCSPGCSRLDRRLADGEDPAGGPLLVARAAQLARPHVRRRTAAHWQRILDEVGSRPKPLTHPVPVCTEQVADAASSMPRDRFLTEALHAGTWARVCR
jgi:hypothetical protein